MENRKLIKDCLDRENPYILLKESKILHSKGEWNLHGRKYSTRAISTLCRQNEIYRNYEIVFEPPELKSEIDELVRKCSNKQSCLEQKDCKNDSQI